IHTPANICLTLTVGLAAAALFVWLDTPLPWMMGPLVVIACLRMLGLKLWAPTLWRISAHVVIGMALGLYFTPDVVARMLSLWLPIMLGMVFAMSLSLSFAAVLRNAGLDPVTAYFSGGIGGATEMSVMGERYGGNVAIIIAVHTLRVVVVVVLMPFAFRALDIHGSDLFTPAVSQVVWPGLAMLLIASLLVTWPIYKLGWPNAWMLGPLFAVSLVTMTGHAPSALPAELVKLGQLAVGMTLGCRFGPQTIADVRRIVWVLLATTAAGIGLATLFATLIALVAHLPVSTMVLATSPGGITEMALTAKVLQLGVPVVTVFHVTRLVFMLLVYGPMFPMLARRFNWHVPAVRPESKR
ncbi:MAG: AbrB family transcriptional regulator, partial [Burkholderiaceae bacterium]